MCSIPKIMLISCMIVFILNIDCTKKNNDYIRPFSENPKYWQYKGEPVLLVGGSKDDNLFQLPDLKRHLDSLAQVGGNYIRNTMSSRVDKGWEIQPFLQLEDGRYDLEQWNKDYWQRVSNMLDWTFERDIIVQIEIWDRFDYSRNHWLTSPWNPANNINYTYEQSGFAQDYPLHPSRDVHPFFHSIPGTEHYIESYNVFRPFQEKFVDHLLSMTLNYPNILYCMNNETSSSPLWGQYWIRRIRNKAEDRNVGVFTTDMFDDFWKGQESEHVEMVFQNSYIYDEFVKSRYSFSNTTNNS